MRLTLISVSLILSFFSISSAQAFDFVGQQQATQADSRISLLDENHFSQGIFTLDRFFQTLWAVLPQQLPGLYRKGKLSSDSPVSQKITNGGGEVVARLKTLSQLSQKTRDGHYGRLAALEITSASGQRLLQLSSLTISNKVFEPLEPSQIKAGLLPLYFSNSDQDAMTIDLTFFDKYGIKIKLFQYGTDQTRSVDAHFYNQEGTRFLSYHETRSKSRHAFSYEISTKGLKKPVVLSAVHEVLPEHIIGAETFFQNYNETDLGTFQTLTESTLLSILFETSSTINSALSVVPFGNNTFKF